MSSAAPSTPPVTETTFVATSAGHDKPPPPIKGLRRLMIWIVPANLSIFLVWGAVPGILLPQHITVTLGEQDKVANLAIVASFGAFFAMVAQPIAGQISDRTRSRFGRRAPWILIGAIAGGLALVGLTFADTLMGIVIGWTLVQIGYNFAQGPLSAMMPDRVPVTRRGSFSALFGIGGMVGALGGQIIGSLFFHSITIGYILFAVIAIVVLTLFVIFNPDYSSKNFSSEPFNVREFLQTFWVNPIKHPDFFWAFTGRLLLNTGFFVIIAYQLFLLTDYFHVDEPETIIPILGLLAIVGIVISTAISGPLSDRVGRRKPFVIASGIVLSLAYLLPWVWIDLNAWIIMTVIAGFGMGMFQAVDTALISEVLPSAKSFAKDLGVVNIAATMPQTIAPGIAGAIVLLFGYSALFPIAIIFGLLGAVAVIPIKTVR